MNKNLIFIVGSVALIIAVLYLVQAVEPPRETAVEILEIAPANR